MKGAGLCGERSCAHCYAEVMARRLKAMGTEKYKKGFQLSFSSNGEPGEVTA